LAEKQATVPERSKLLPNEVGIAKGIIVEQGITTVYALPGVPLELEVMFANGVLPLLLKGQRGRSCSSEVIKTAGISESVLMQKIGKISKIYPDIELGFYPNYGEVTLILKTILAKKAKLRLLKNKIQNKLKPWVYADQEISLTEAVALKLKKKKYKISTAESCTGGLIAKRLTDTSGASAYFKGGIIAYNNAIKIQHLGVEASALKKYGAVSSVVARQMAKGAMRQFKTQVAISITGIAGPSGGTKSKPVGTVFMCISIKNKLAMYSLKIKGSRTVIRYRASQIAMIQLLKLLSRS